MADNGVKRTNDILNLVGRLGGWVFGAIALVVTIVFWIQGSGDSKYYTKVEGRVLKEQVTKLETKLDNIESQNRDIIRILGRLEGADHR